mmetsp:Transcript_13161/g.32270  ORF Transcript_13161/g.32270 Transcript_13161/m.32270 type:complete len:314 (-) Transcript_13161:749-1690(-)
MDKDRRDTATVLPFANADAVRGEHAWRKTGTDILRQALVLHPRRQRQRAGDEAVDTRHLCDRKKARQADQRPDGPQLPALEDRRVPQRPDAEVPRGMALPQPGEDGGRDDAHSPGALRRHLGPHLLHRRCHQHPADLVGYDRHDRPPTWGAVSIPDSIDRMQASARRLPPCWARGRKRVRAFPLHISGPVILPPRLRNPDGGFVGAVTGNCRLLPRGDEGERVQEEGRPRRVPGLDGRDSDKQKDASEQKVAGPCPELLACCLRSHSDYDGPVLCCLWALLYTCRGADADVERISPCRHPDLRAASAGYTLRG